MATATKKSSVKKTSKAAAVKKAPAKSKGPGVIDSILEFLQGANSKVPLTKDQLVQKLAARFKDREATALKTTVNCQLGKRIEEARKVKLNSNDQGYWITSK